ncbi:hypothetical protein GCM10009784_26950 [Arthrobacter parietis]|uniref:Uncharacterized protein n=1 Tax=Arthrobacter parietis TaxID=271434 RepID=A0ABN3B0K0_9MICC
MLVDTGYLTGVIVLALRDGKAQRRSDRIPPETSAMLSLVDSLMAFEPMEHYCGGDPNQLANAPSIPPSSALAPRHMTVGPDQR